MVGGTELIWEIPKEMTSMRIVDDTNLRYYETYLAQTTHIMPNVNTVRCEIWYFRKHREPGKILDYGFGSGQELMYFAEQGYDVYGLDIVQSAKDKFDSHIHAKRPELRDKIKTRILEPEATALPFPDASFDFIHSNGTVCLLPSEGAIKVLLNEWHRVLKPGGLFMFSTIHPQNSQIQTGRANRSAVPKAR